MVCFKVLLFVHIVHIVTITTTSGQTDTFEYECDVLSRLDRLEKELKETTVKLEIVENELKAARAAQGSSYFRWGRTTCPGNGTELVYSGLAGGSWYGHAGASANYLCLSASPVYGKYTEAATQLGGLVYGAEYQFTGRTNGMAFFPELVDRTNLDHHDVPCAVCMTHRSTVLMVPARNTCMDGCTLEYKGLLFSGRFTDAAAGEYICVDDQPERRASGSSNLNGKLLYLVEGRCGSLPCPPYVDGRELTCAVCSK